MSNIDIYKMVCESHELKDISSFYSFIRQYAEQYRSRSNIKRRNKADDQEVFQKIMNDRQV